MTLKHRLLSGARHLAGSALGFALAASLVAPVAAQTEAAPVAPAAPAVAAAAAAPIQGNPALWVIRDADSTIYLFGTFHALRPTTSWRTPAVEQALASAGELWLEIDEPDPAAMGPLIQQLGLSPQRPLSSRLTPEENAALAAAAQRAGMPAQALEPMRPWLAGLTLTVVPLLQAGYDPQQGVDTLLRRAAVERGQAVRAFETPEQQFRFFADMPEEQELDFLRAALEDVEEGPAMIEAMAADWAEGDVAGIERAMISEMQTEAPELYQLLIVRRNAAWTTRIQQMLAGSGTAFIAVGAGHLAGPDSVQAMLERQGVRSERLNAPAS